MSIMPEGLLTEARALQPQLLADRRQLHAHPEVGPDLPQTREYVARRLREMGYDPRPLAGGLTADITGRDTGRCVLLRADIDALRITERTDLPFRAENGAMHACGHDLHAAMLLGAAQLLRQHQAELSGTVRLVFQPDEEGFTGAKAMLAAGVLTAEPRPQSALALHVHSGTPTGLVLCGRGTFMAGCTLFRVTVRGTGCHGAMPETGVDPLNIAAHIYLALQELPAREVAAKQPAVITVGELHGGTARNVIAGTAYLAGTVRTYGDKTHEEMPELMRRIVEHTAAALGAEAELTDYTIANYKVENDAASSERCRQAVLKCLGPAGEGHYRGTLSGEDFSEYLRRVPGVLAFVGTRNPQIGATYAQHSCFYKIDESVLAKGSMVAAQYAIDFLAEPTQEELDGPTIAAVAETNPDLAAKLRSAKATAAEARDAMHDARTARHAAIKGIHDARAAARHEEKRDE